jgi:hypothetical protein
MRNNKLKLALLMLNHIEVYQSCLCAKLFTNLLSKQVYHKNEEVQVHVSDKKRFLKTLASN